MYDHDTVSSASSNATGETCNLEDWSVQGLWHSYDSGNLGRTSCFFSVMSNDSGNNTDPLLIATLPPRQQRRM